MKMEFWFEFGSTYSYPAAMRVEQLAAQRGLPLVWKPFLLGPIFMQMGWNDSPFNIYPAKGRYMWRDLERRCASYEISFRRPSAFPRSGLLAARIACWFDSESWVPEFVRRVYRANFAEDQEISDPTVIAAVLSSLGLPNSHLVEAGLPESKMKLRQQTDRAASLGIFGAPTFTVDGEIFWGDDRLEDALAWRSGSGERRKATVSAPP